MADIEHMSAMAMEKREKREKKRLRFTGDQDSDEDEPKGPKQALFPKGKKQKDKELLMDVNEEGEEGPLLAADPRVAAKERATRRRDRIATDDTGMLDDVGDAEEEYQGQDPDEVNVIEPFNLKKEREDGYFDAEGNYVEYRLDNNITDPWLESAEVDESLAKKTLARAASADEPLPELSAQDMGALKRRIADALEPGETVLQGLQRLGGRKEGKKKGSGTGRGERMPEDKKEKFDRLTEDAMSLMDAGEYGVYSEKKETFEREAAGYEALVRARSGPPKGGDDMFADSDDEEGPSNPKTSNGASGTGSVVTTGGSKAETARPHTVLPATRTEDSETNAGQSSEQREGTQGRDEKQGVGDGTTGETGTGNIEGGVTGTAPSDESGYVYDPSSGYYYNSDVGYYYDSNTGLFCSASNGLWYRYIDETNTYEEVVGG